MNKKEIKFKNEIVDVEILPDNTFAITYGGKEIKVQYMQDNEGAVHWMNMETNKETEETKALGLELEKLLKPE